MATQSAVEIDFSLPISTLLRISTAAAHDAVEKSRGASWLARGELDREEYVRFMMMLWHVYDALEQGLEQHATHPVLSIVHNPVLLARVPSLSADISHFLRTTDWKPHPIHAALMDDPPAALTDYVSQIQSIARSGDPAPLLAHAYVRYLGDLSGGQIIRNRIVKAYDLTDGAGVSFFEFKQLDGMERANMGDMKKIKEWYRRQMDKSVGDNRELKAALIEEANKVYLLNAGLFSCLNMPSTLKSTEPARPPLGEPMTPVAEEHSEPSKVIFEETKQPEKTYSLSSVIAVIAAMSLAHLILVVGGFTGERGYAKLEMLRDWLTGR
ncbi:heme oxygenase [Laetiporus sulphureus 93-53]|uniref:Heme oxygenase n=1 Tax=Laetiporus sulphureus 93-53 TaxID=1314785 RepID=A0A165HUM8_9APHY|nr:heme oxygenase [Laetiporus sulphureus 93-53]KZT12210.1 heme oxygenase [Laetiporus sulphureus 93-53]